MTRNRPRLPWPVLVAALFGCIDAPDEHVDADADGYPEGPDCDDDDPAIHPEAAEICDGLDNDCDGRIDDDDEVDEPLTWYFDGDGDDFGDPDRTAEVCSPPPNYIRVGDDCDDTDDAIHPGATEICDGLDNNCTGGTDADDPELDPTDALTLYADTDGDGHGDPDAELLGCEVGEGTSLTATDCDDTRDDVHPDTEEVCNDLVDNDCDGGLNDCWLSDRRLGAADRSLEGAAKDQFYGFDVLIADLDADGLAEVVVGAWGDKTSTTQQGAVYVYAGADLAADIRAPAEAVWLGEGYGHRLGLSLADGGDLDGDGDHELLIGAPGANLGGDTTGAVYVIDGGSLRSSGSIASAYTTAWSGGLATHASLGDTVAGYGDIDGDGYADIGLGAGYDSAGSPTGALYLVYGSPTLPVGDQDLTHADAVLTGAAGTNAGSLGGQGGAGDLDGDGLDDWAVGAPNAQGEKGEVYLFYGDTTRLAGTLVGAAVADAIVAGDTARAAFGERMTGGDLTGDGYSDLLVSEQRGYSGRGAVWVFEGGPTPMSGGLTAADSTLALYGVSGSASQFGSSVTVVDLEGDGGLDVVVGGPNYAAGGTTSSGAVYLFRGPFTAASYTARDESGVIEGVWRYQALGYHSIGAGDVNGDGYPDLLFGGYGADDFKGSAALFLGLGL